MGKILPILLALIGLAAGVGGGIMLRPPPEVVEINPCGEGEAAPKPAAEEDLEEEGATSSEFVKLNNQFVVPIIESEKVKGLVVLSLSIEVETGSREGVYQREPKLQDALLQTLFDHANRGGFDGVFTQSSRLDTLRTALTESARVVLGPVVIDVEVTNIVRQDI
ncbi:flagellar basal body-associated FliL family protein [Aliiroseovarius marinus]|uniref:flagellar basal body-associated FliL family protein n=1 Tax=Aliiroseovarius marinus TaxID=2500159 RepID=UPI003D7DFEB6